MNKIRVLIGSSILILIFLIVIGGIMIAQDIRMISVESAYLKEKPENFSETLKTLHLFDQVEVLEELDTWLLVITMDDDEMEGYIQASSVTTEGVGTEVSEDLTQGDAATAGARGFNEDVESEYKKTTSYDYDAVDEAEEMTDPYVEDPENRFKPFRQEGYLGEFQK